MTEPETLDAFLSEAWGYLARGVADRRTPTLATVSPDGLPEARTVVLRHLNQNEGWLEVHTDLATPKAQALRHTPVAVVHVWLPKARLQIRLSTRVDLRHGAEVEDAWAQVPEASRVSYGSEPTPGTRIPDRGAFVSSASNRDRFVVLRCFVQDIDLLHLGTPHSRARFSVGDGFQGAWVVP